MEMSLGSNVHNIEKIKDINHHDSTLSAPDPEI